MDKQTVVMHTLGYGLVTKNEAVSGGSLSTWR